MQIKVFTIPIIGGEMLLDEMNVFLRSKKVLQVKEHLINHDKEGVFWCFSVRYVEDVTAVVGIFEQIIVSYEASIGRGLPIGNLTSQYFANHYLNGLDRFVKEKLRVQAYVRYMDDMFFWHSEKNRLLEVCAAVHDFILSNLYASLKPAALNRTSSGLPFLGYHIFPHHVRLLQKSKQRFIRKLDRIEKGYHLGDWNEAKCQRRVLPLIAFTDHADAKKLRQSVLLNL